MSAPIAKSQLNFELPQLSYVDASLEEANLRAPAPPRKPNGLVAALVAAFRTWQDKRAALFELDQMTDRELADIGLNRGDIHRVTHFG
jgi:uncharacterized protein YjiS (DUF1127 family)